jgi:6-phosphofructokinase 1
LAYGVAVAGEAHMVVGVEDVDEALRRDDGALDPDRLVERIVDLMVTRERRGKGYGLVVLAEGLTTMLPDEALGDAARDAYGHVSFSTHDLSRTLARAVGERYQARTGNKRKVTGVQLGYESRCAEPHAFDVLLGTQLGFGAYRALVEEGLDAHMVSVAGQLELRYVPFSRLLDPDTLTARMRFIAPGSDFHRLAQQLGTRLEEE